MSTNLDRYSRAVHTSCVEGNVRVIQEAHLSHCRTMKVARKQLRICRGALTGHSIVWGVPSSSPCTRGASSPDVMSSELFAWLHFALSTAKNHVVCFCGWWYPGREMKRTVEACRLRPREQGRRHRGRFRLCRGRTRAVPHVDSQGATELRAVSIPSFSFSFSFSLSK